ncbi:MAG: tRNA lysidine(34) synthetase TilS [Oscillospiraceae bacterium]|nr:tRNA lysidine(34) synthetase TilS [Oscillospiraceae bacterium]
MNTELLPRDGRILCAVSGGADSMYLLCRLRELGCDVCAAHYNHGLRGEASDRDEAFVRDFCEREHIPFLTGRGDVRAYAAENSMSIEEAARALRYDFLGQAAETLGAAVIATAHNAGDNGETMLLNLARGTGLKGLCGIPPVRGRIVRPMLDVTHEQALEYLAAHDISHVEDETNRQDEYARNRVRHWAVPALESVNPAFSRAAGQTAALLREDEAFLSRLAAEFVAQYREENTLPAKILCGQPFPIASRAVRLMAGRELSYVHVQAVLKTARDGGVADVPGMAVGREGDRLVFGIKPAAPIQPRTILVPGRTDIPEAGIALICTKISAFPPVVHKQFNIFFFNCENIYGNIMVTARQPGDRLRPVGRGCTKELKQLFQETGVPFWRRQGVPVLRDERGVIAVCGVGPAERAAARPEDNNIIQIEFIRL